MIVIAESMALKNASKSIEWFDANKVAVECNDIVKLKCKNLMEHNNEINIGFRKFRPGIDERLLANMENDFFKYGNIVTEEAIRERFEKTSSLTDLAIFICVNNVPIGFGQIVDTKNGFMLGSVGIVSEYRGCGFGKILVSYLVRAAIEYGLRNLHLYVRLNNKKARKLYSSLGFKHNGYSITFEFPEKLIDIITKFKNLIFE